MIEAEPGRTKLRHFKDAVQRQLVREVFTTPEDLAVKVATSVGRYITEVVSAPLYPVVSGLRKLIEKTSDDPEVYRRVTREALSAAVEIANQTLQYIAERRRTGQRNERTEVALAEGWTRAGLKLSALRDPPIELAQRYFEKAEYWSFPEQWTDERINASRIGINEIARESRSLLLSRFQSPI
jgi:hypothetical protein